MWLRPLFWELVEVGSCMLLSDFDKKGGQVQASHFGILTLDSEQITDGNYKYVKSIHPVTYGHLSS